MTLLVPLARLGVAFLPVWGRACAMDDQHHHTASDRDTAETLGPSRRLGAVATYGPRPIGAILGGSRQVVGAPMGLLAWKFRDATERTRQAGTIQCSICDAPTL